ncbi:hypothetical protein [Myxosarcina sp. GI1]|uniref:hypothetical protein n=1 Tax=Myxosarcina sp. GI1 TaxID=1541065 RepID=UPI00068EDC8A|nr:hypothetical protein [Myxosarcina sp. GI1]
MSIINYQFIIYACPVGKLNSQIETYFNKSRELYGENSAHKYMPHCSLTGFFADELSSIPTYIQALNKAYIEAENNLSVDIEIKQLSFRENWHGLELQAEGLKQLMFNFTRIETSTTRQEVIRIKDWLHLSLAYDFDRRHSAELKNLALEIIALKAKVDWELCFYQKNADWTWTCLKTWSLV